MRVLQDQARRYKIKDGKVPNSHRLRIRATARDINNKSVNISLLKTRIKNFGVDPKIFDIYRDIDIEKIACVCGKEKCSYEKKLYEYPLID